MIVERIWTASPLRNFNYLVACSETGEAIAVDPLDAELCRSRAQELGFSITQIVNTHEHFDHVAGNEALQRQTGATISAHPDARDAIAGMNRALGVGASIRVGKTVALEVLHTPGHTMKHLCLLGHGDSPALFCGDTLFNAGVGNCKSGGDAHMLFKSVHEQLARLPQTTRIYPGHDYLETNLRFTLSLEPQNTEPRALLSAIENDGGPASATIMDLATEKKVNAFLRLSSPEVVAAVRERFPDLPKDPSPETVFVRLRALRDVWT